MLDRECLRLRRDPAELPGYELASCGERFE